MLNSLAAAGSSCVLALFLDKAAHAERLQSLKHLFFFTSFYRRDDRFRHKVIQSNESQTGSGFIPALSNHITAGELASYHTFSAVILQEHCTIDYELLHHHHHHYHYAQHPITLTSSSIIHPHHYRHQQTELTFKNVEIYLCISHIITAVLIK